MSKKFKYSLDRSSKKFICSICGKKTFVKYVLNSTNTYVGEIYGRCDRENNCGYHLLPPWNLICNNDEYKSSDEAFVEKIINLEHSIDFVPETMLKSSMKDCLSSNFAEFLIAKFGTETVNKLIQKYFVGFIETESQKGNIFWRIDQNQNIRNGKIMVFDSSTGRRIKGIAPKWIHYKIKANFNYLNCFFGEHLLSEFPEKDICIVESEKTAIVCSYFKPEYNWLSSGGLFGVKWGDSEVYNVLKNKNVFLYPDCSNQNIQGKSPLKTWIMIAEDIQNKIPCNIRVSKLLENIISPSEKKGQDLADILLNF